MGYFTCNWQYGGTLITLISVFTAKPSGRKAAQYNGCFAIQPTHGVLDAAGVGRSFPYVSLSHLSYYGRI